MTKAPNKSPQLTHFKELANLNHVALLAIQIWLRVIWILFSQKTFI